MALHIGWGQGICLFVDLFNRHLLNTSYVSGIVLGAQDKAVSKNKPFSHKTCIVAGVER